jgi:hypothetical protein
MSLPREIVHSLCLIALFALTSASVLGAGLLFGWVLG